MFGVHFTFRTGNYENFKTKTGGIFFLIYLIVIIFYFTFGLYNYFINSHYEALYWDESFFENEINLKDQEFFFGITDLNQHIPKKELKIIGRYESLNKTYEIKERNCTNEDFNFDEKINYKNKNLYCYDNKINETITVNTYSKKQIIYEFKPGEKAKNNSLLNFYKIQGVYPINYFKGENHKVLGMNEMILIPYISYNAHFYLEKNIYINDDELFFGKNTTKVITNVYRLAIYNSQRNVEDKESPFLTVRLRQRNKVKVKYTKRKRLYTVLLEMISMATTLLVNFRAVVSLLNLKKAKQNIFEEIFHLNAYKKYEEKDKKIHIEIPSFNPNRNPNVNKEIEIKIIPDPKDKDKDNSERRNLHQSNNLNQSNKGGIDNIFSNNNNNNDWIFQENFELRPRENEEERIRRERIQFVLRNNKREKINRNTDNNNNNNNNNNDQNNENEIKENKEIKEKMNLIIKNYPTIGGKSNYKNDPRFVRNIFYQLYLYITCEKKRLNEINLMNEIIDEEFARYMNIHNFIQRGKRLEVIQDILFDKNEANILEYIALPLLSFEKKENKNKKFVNKSLDNVDGIFEDYNEINKKNRKTVIERKLVDFFRNKINEN